MVITFLFGCRYRDTVKPLRKITTSINFINTSVISVTTNSYIVGTLHNETTNGVINFCESNTNTSAVASNTTAIVTELSAIDTDGKTIPMVTVCNKTYNQITSTPIPVESLKGYPSFHIDCKVN